MQADAHLQGEAVVAPMLREAVLDGDGAVDGGLCAIEGDGEAVAAAARREERSERLVVPAQEVFPGRVADSLDEVGGLDDVREHERLGGALGGHCAAARRARTKQ